MKYAKILLFSFVVPAQLLFAQTRRALVIGIDKYAPPANEQISNESGRVEYDDLDGCRNDALTVKSILGARYEFKTEHIRELYDGNATRKNILNAMRALLNECKPGDIATIYYAGHGSQQKNSKSREADKKDESIVPADAWKKGVGDIRDKEQAVIYNAFIDKGVILTVILDCCHSGSMSRGTVYGRTKSRYLPANNYDANDPSNPSAPENREGGNFLMISAAQDNESASEQKDDNNIAHGAFTLAFVHAINEQPVDAAVSNIFASIRAILKSYGKTQEPGLAGSNERKEQTLFGIKRGVLSDKTYVAVSETDNGKIKFLGGYAIGLNKENELTMVNGSTVVRIDSLIGINRSEGTVIKGSVEDIKPGSLFEITNWVSSRAPLLKVFIPHSGLSYSDILKLASIDKEIKSSGKVQWVNDLSKALPYSSFWYNENILYANVDGKISNNIQVTNATEFEKLSAGKSFFFNLPLSERLAGVLRNKFTGNRNISIVENASEADYMIFGTVDDKGAPGYGLIRRQISLRDSLESLPLQSKYFSLTDDTEDANVKLADSIYLVAGRLAKMRGWLNLSGPTRDYFPFHLAIINAITKKEIGPHGYKVGDRASLHLIADPIPKDRQFDIKRKFIYAFVIDHDGKMQLLFPFNNADNRVPVLTSDNKLLEDIELLHDYYVTEPVGTDNFFLLASSEPIADAENIFRQEGVGSREVSTGTPGAMETLLNLGNEGARSIDKTPTDWNLLKISVKTTHR